MELAKALGDEGAIGVLNEAAREWIHEEWRTSTITPIYKQKGDPLECNNFRGIQLLSNTLKLWERVVQSRLRKISVWIPTGKVNDPTIVLLTDATRKTKRVWKGAACGVCGPGKGLWQGTRGADNGTRSDETKGCSRGLHKHNPGHVCWVQDKRHVQCGKDRSDRDWSGTPLDSGPFWQYRSTSMLVFL